MIPIPHLVSDQMILCPVCTLLHWAVDRAPASNQPKDTTSGNYGDYEECMRGGPVGTGPTGTIAENSTVASGKGVRQYSRVSMYRKMFCFRRTNPRQRKFVRAVSEHQRHRWFGSLKSSQALAPKRVRGDLRLRPAESATGCAHRVRATGLLRRSQRLDARIRA